MDQITIKTTKTAADKVIISVGETIGVEITYYFYSREAIVGEISRITATITSKTSIFSSKDIKTTKQQ